MNPFVIAVDIGNTNIAIGLVDTKQLCCLQKETFSLTPSIKHNSDNIISAIEHLCNDQGIVEPVDLKICSVVSFSYDLLLYNLSMVTQINRTRFIRYSETLPFGVQYKNPDHLGTDRIANCLYGFYKYPNENIILIDIGTATTIDILTEEKVFIGGYILPGPQTQLESLHKETSNLPLLDVKRETLIYPPDSTAMAIKSGIYHSVAGGISFIVAKIEEEEQKKFRILASGGGWKSVEPLIRFPFEYDEYLTLVGTGLY